MPTLRITESRLALIVSVAALLITAWQGYEARKANALNQEALRIDVQPSDIPSKRIEKIVCYGDGITTAYLYWRVNIYNSSSQPVTIKDIFSMSTTPDGQASGIGPIGKDGPVNRQFPVIVEPKNFKTFLLPVPTLTSKPFGMLFRERGGCDGKLDWGNVTNREGFTETGWFAPRSVNALFKVTTGDGNEFTAISNWP